jgi:AcrR family transcriptional regulator
LDTRIGEDRQIPVAPSGLIPPSLVKPPRTSPVDKRAAILNAALDLFEEHGFEATSVPEIAGRAQVAVGTIYRYFESKEAVVNSLYRLWRERFNGSVLAPIDAQLGVRHVFGTYWRRMSAFSRAFPKAQRFLDLHHHGGYLDAESLALDRAYSEVIAHFIAEGVVRGALRMVDPRIAVAMIWGTLAGLHKFSGPRGMDEMAIAEAEASIWNAIKA